MVYSRVLLNGASGDHRRNGMLENQLLLVTGFEHKRILVETLDPTGKFDTAQEVDGDQSLFLARIIEKTVLDVLRWLIHLYGSKALKKFGTAGRADSIVTQQQCIFPDGLYFGR